MKTFFATLALLTAIATPVFAQSFCACDGTGNVLPYSYQPTGTQNGMAAVSRSGLEAFASAPVFGRGINPDAPAATGGGSLGYNEKLREW